MKTDLTSGSRLGPYVILARLGAGGMGEVYRASDARIGREVAIKVLPAALSRDPDRLRRFEQEVRAVGALNHPNILTIHDVGTEQGAPYLVSELLVGETLRERLGSGPLPPRKIVEYAAAIARGLAAAHAKGIVHRDLKPENVFLTRDGHLKILDFGLAKLAEAPAASSTHAPTATILTEPGAVMGTAGYMSPEQVRGQTVDHRADIFALGAILYEMSTGHRAFQGHSLVECMNAVLKEEPPPLSEPALDRIVRRCLEKNPEERFQSAADLSFALAAGSVVVTAVAPALPVRTRRRLFLALAGVGVMSVVAAAAFVAGRRTTAAPHPSFHQLTFRRGSIQTAQFAPDEQTIVYAAQWEGKPWELFSTRVDSLESRPFGMSNAEILSISSAGEMAILLNAHAVGGIMGAAGTLARVSLAGGAPREVLEDVASADWSPDGKELAVARYVAGRNRLEFPIGKVLYETAGVILSPRFSPKGDRIAFMENGPVGSSVRIVDLAGKSATLVSGLATSFGLAWPPNGDEVWFAGGGAGAHASLFAVTLDGRRRPLLEAPGELALRDIARDGRVLLISHRWRNVIAGVAPGESVARDLSWLDLSNIADISSDGRTLLLLGFEPNGVFGVYLRSTDGSPAVRLGETASGTAAALSPDAKWALTIRSGPSPQLVLLPTGAGEARVVEEKHVTPFGALGWLPDGKRIVFSGAATGQGPRLYLRDLDESARAIAPEGAGVNGDYCVSPDGRLLAASQADQELWLYPLNGGEARRAPGTAAGDIPARFTADGRALFVFRRQGFPIPVDRLDLETGKRVRWKDLAPVDPAGAGLYYNRVLLTPDGSSYYYDYTLLLSELQWVDGLK